jgi:hypothetical protein
MDTVVEENPLSFATSRIVTMVRVSKFQGFKVSVATALSYEL